MSNKLYGIFKTFTILGVFFDVLFFVSQMLLELELLHRFVKRFPNNFQPKQKQETPVIITKTLF